MKSKKEKNNFKHGFILVNNTTYMIIRLKITVRLYTNLLTAIMFWQLTILSHGKQ